ncbi:Dynamin-like GTPase that mediates homotypic ER fusion [Mitosporidium daphniae]
MSSSSSSSSSLYKHTNTYSTSEQKKDAYQQDTYASKAPLGSQASTSSSGVGLKAEFADKKPSPHQSDFSNKPQNFPYDAARSFSNISPTFSDAKPSDFQHSKLASYPSMSSTPSLGDSVSTSSLLTLLSRTTSSSCSIPSKIPSPSINASSPLLQLVDENQAFNNHLEHHLCDVLHLYPRGGTSTCDYKVIAVFGAQSSGKSTLLNALFGTAFPVMRDEVRSQTTKGIWLSKSQGAPFLILDVEGTDGRERGENQDFERKAALFSLAIAQVVIINMWEYSVGLYNAANMVLLKTVLEVHAQLFQNQKSSVRTTLLFVIRDFIGTTPFSQLQNIIKNDLASIWSSLSSKNKERHDSLEDHFIIAFANLPHKVLKPDDFSRQIKDLATRFYDADSSNPNSAPIFAHINRSDSSIVPLDGFAAYASGIWERVKTNKDLDLPTQQQLLAQFRCAELCQIAWDRLETALAGLTLSNGALHPSLGASLDALLTSADAEFLGAAQRYHPATVERQRMDLLEKSIVTFRPIVTEQLRTASRRALLLFVGGVEAGMRSGTHKFSDIVASNSSSAASFFDEKANTAMPQSLNTGSDTLRQMGISPIDWGLSDVRKELLESINERASFYKREELQRAITLVSDSFQKALTRRLSGLLDDASSGALESRKKSASEGERGEALSGGSGLHSSSGVWEALFQLYPRLVGDAQTALSNRISGILSSDLSMDDREKDKNAAQAKELGQKLYRSCWDHMLTRLKEDFTTTSVVLARLKRRFDRTFRYDAKGAPRLWTPGEDVNKPYSLAIEQTTLLLEDFSELVGIPIGASFVPSSQTMDRIPLMSPEQKALIKESFLRDAELAFIEATRSTLLQPRTQIPTWLIVLLIVLGWNEFMAILGSPFYFLIALILVGILVVYGYLPAFGSLIPTATSISNILISRALEYIQQFAAQERRPEAGHSQRRSTFSPSSSGSSLRTQASHFDTHKPSFGGNRSSPPSFSPDLAANADFHDDQDDDEYASNERTSLLSTISKK